MRCNLKIKTVFFILLALMFATGQLCSGQAVEELKTTEESSAVSPIYERVGKMIKDIRLPEDQLPSLSLDMKMSLPLPLEILCQLRYKAPDKYSLRVYDGIDSAPVLIIDENLAMINDPFSEDDVMLIASCGIAFSLVPQNNQYTANFAFNTAGAGQIKDKVEIDLVTLFSRVKHDLKLNEIEDGNLLEFSGTSDEKSRCVAVLDPAAPLAVKSLRLYIAENPVPVLNFSKFIVGGEIPAGRFSFPIVKLESSGLKISRHAPDGMIDTFMVAAQVMKAVFARSAIRSPEAREQIESMLKQKVDWKAAEKRDSLRSEQLRQVFPIEL